MKEKEKEKKKVPNKKPSIGDLAKKFNVVLPSKRQRRKAS